MEFLEVQYLDYYYFCYILMIYQIFLISFIFFYLQMIQIFILKQTIYKIHEVLIKGLKLLRDWLIANRLALTVSKTNFAIFSPPNKPYQNITLLINKKAIEQKEYVKYLGVLLDSKLSFCHHISSIKKISRAIGIIHKMKTFVSRNILICLYYSLVYPFLIYAIGELLVKVL